MSHKNLLEVYDLEQLANVFTYTGYELTKNKWYQFVISKYRNDIDELYNHLMNRGKIVQIGFNNENYDYPLLHHLINHYKEYRYLDAEVVATKLYDKSQFIISQEFSSIADKHKYITQIDLFRIFHYNNKARSTSLKDLEIAMCLENVEEMPFHYTHWCNEEDIEKILAYNKNDVYATAKFYMVALGKSNFPLYKGKNVIELRQSLNKKFNLNCLNYPDVKIGEQLVLKLYCDKKGIPINQLKQQGGTKRDVIRLKDCLPPWANFKSKEFKKVKEQFENTVIYGQDSEFKISTVFHGIQVDYGIGGVHACIKPGVYEADENHIIVDQDVGSLYPSLAIQLGLFPEHLGKLFLDIYDKDIVSVRLSEKVKPKKERDQVIMEGYKLAANGIYGKSGEESSILYDLLYTYSITCSGQMFISLWAEKLVEAIPDIKFLQKNTDGVSYIVQKKHLHLVSEVSKYMTDLTGLYIEDNYYTKMVIRDVNNYIAQYENGDVKYKGCFEIDKEFHKDPSMRIVPIALSNYFLKGIPIKDTVLNHEQIFDFCLRLKTNSQSTGHFVFIDDNREVRDISLPRTTRYYMSKSGGKIHKDFGDGRKSGVFDSFSATLFNKYTVTMSRLRYFSLSSCFLSKYFCKFAP